MFDPAIKRASDLRIDLFVHPELEIQIPKKSQQRVVGEFMQWVVRPVPGNRQTQLVRSLRQWIRGRFQHLRHLVISDDPGQGKTVLSLQIQKLLCTPKSRSRIFGDSNPRLVVHWMSRLPQTTISHPSILDVLMADPSLVGTFEDESVREKVIHYAMAEGRLVIVLDAFDEMPADQKRQVANLFDQSLDKIRWIVTGRDWAINWQIADQTLFVPSKFFRMRIKAFSTELQDRYMSRALPGVDWRSVLSGPEEDWDELLGLPATLRELIRALSLMNRKTSKALRFESPSDLFCFSSQQMLLRELRKDKNVKAIAEDGLDLKLTVAARLVQRAIGAVALEMALWGHWREVIKPTTPELDKEVQYIWECVRKRFMKGGDEVSGASWKWVEKFLKQYEFNGGASQADLGSESLVFRNVRVHELNLARFIVDYSSQTDLQGKTKNRANRVSKRVKRAQSVIECLGLESWENTWRSAIKMPVLERGKDHGVNRKCYEQGLRLLFERPTQVDQRRPTWLMWEADQWVKQRHAEMGAKFRAHLRGQFLAIVNGPDGKDKEIARDLIDLNNFVVLADPQDMRDEFDTGIFQRRGQEVHLSRYRLCKYAVSNEQYWLFDNNFVGVSRPGNFNSSLQPAVYVNWYDAYWYCEFVEIGLKELRVVLPTEAQFEYAARSGSTGDYFRNREGQEVTEQNLADYANFGHEWGYYSYRSCPVKGHGKDPNAWGLELMAGNVWEWCWDWCEEYPEDAVLSDPVGPDEGSHRAARGGNFWSVAADCRTEYRGYCYPLGGGYPYRSSRSLSFGFRVALSSSGIPK